MILDPLNAAIILPEAVYNWEFEKIYMPPITGQGGQQICAQASIVYYVFTYEINWMRGTDAEYLSNQFQPSFTYNLLNGGSGAGKTYISDGIDILKEAGCPDVETYGASVGTTEVPNPDATEWMTGYDNYKTALGCRVVETEKIDIQSDLVPLKYWLYNHNDPTYDEGGIGSVVFAHMSGVHRELCDPNNPEGPKYIAWANYTTQDDAHAMTIVGYDNNMQCGSYTGALILANSWGDEVPTPANSGYEYLPYAKINAPNMLYTYDNDAIWVFVLHVDPNFIPKFILDVKLSHPHRTSLWLGAGYHDIPGSTSPIFPWYHYKS